MSDNDVSDEELKAAFLPEAEVEEEKPSQKVKKSGSTKKRIGIITFVIGLATLVCGLTFLILDLLKKPDVRDAEFIVNVGAWQLKDTPSVSWHFTEVGAGTLTTNAHINDYPFKWRLDGDKMIVETEWLYTLDNEYVYELNQHDNILTLTDSEETYVFVPAESVQSIEQTEEEAAPSEADSAN